MKVYACRSCKAVDFPRRLLCPACGMDAFVEVDASTGRIEELTVLHRRPGIAGVAPEVIVTVSMDAGPRVITRLRGDAAPGAAVSLEVESDGAIVARPR